MNYEKDGNFLDLEENESVPLPIQRKEVGFRCSFDLESFPYTGIHIFAKSFLRLTLFAS